MTVIAFINIYLIIGIILLLTRFKADIVDARDGTHIPSGRVFAIFVAIAMGLTWPYWLFRDLKIWFTYTSVIVMLLWKVKNKEARKAFWPFFWRRFGIGRKKEDND